MQSLFPQLLCCATGEIMKNMNNSSIMPTPRPIARSLRRGASDRGQGNGYARGAHIRAMGPQTAGRAWLGIRFGDG